MLQYQSKDIVRRKYLEFCSNSAKRGGDGQLRMREYRRLVGDAQGKCAYCGAALEGNWEIDHKTPLARGGTGEKGNLAVVCRQCNRAKATRTAEEFCVMIQLERGTGVPF